MQRLKQNRFRLMRISQLTKRPNPVSFRSRLVSWLLLGGGQNYPVVADNA